MSVNLLPFPPSSRIRWRRLDVPGHEEAHISRTDAGWLLSGEVHAEESGVDAWLRYTIKCNPAWRTLTAAVGGTVDGLPFSLVLTADGAGHWAREGIPVAELNGALDVDLGFTPATNTIPIRRLSLERGASAPVRTAWLRFPELRVEPLDQTYTREDDLRFRYDASVDGAPFTARLDTDQFGRVMRYEGLWEAELADPA